MIICHDSVMVRVRGRVEKFPVPHAKVAVPIHFQENGAKRLRTTTLTFRVPSPYLGSHKANRQNQDFPINLVRISPISGFKHSTWSNLFRHLRFWTSRGLAPEPSPGHFRSFKRFGNFGVCRSFGRSQYFKLHALKKFRKEKGT